MARLVGIVLVLGAIYTSITYSVENAPQPIPSTATTPRSSEQPAPGPPSAMGSVATARPDPGLDTDDAPDALASSRFAGTYVVSGGSPSRRTSSEGPPGIRGSITPGLYATGFDAGSCRYELRRLMRDDTERVIGEDQLGAGRLLVTINEIEPDWFTSSPGCGEWERWEPLAVPLTEAGSGDYWVDDLARGSWSIPSGCRWESVVGFRGALLSDVIDSTVGPDVVDVDASTLGVRLRGCAVPATLLVPAASGFR
jgi:hypothetical protein